ncbi:nucleotidyltransferase domain-containing protein [Candidatus Woesearchaeota archaeon]|nr:nucleotidyltransferase domain-containing protein [Candidatus Woesearchaeota archaeon]
MITENKIIRMFLEEKGSFTIREISKKIKADYRITYIAAKRLISKNIITAKEVGKSSLCSLNIAYFGREIYDVEAERKEEILKNKDLLQMYKELMKKLETSFFILLIFGSYAKKTQTKHSDIDLIIISNKKEMERLIHNILSLLPLKTHALVFTEDEFTRMLDSKQPNVIKEAVQNNIILYGIESFYRLKNAG